jgi:hypothetical protein
VGVSLAVIVAGAVGCTVDRNGLGNELVSINAGTGGSPPITNDGGVDVSNPPPPDAALDTRSCTTTCEAGAVTVNAPGGRFAGTTAGSSNNAGSCGGGAAPEKVFRVVLTAPSDLFVTTHGTGFDTVLYLRDACCGTELACNDNADGRHTSVLTRTGLAAGVYDLFVDGATAEDAGDFTVDIFLSAASSNPGESCGRPARIANLALTGTTCGFRDDYGPRPGCQASADSSFDTVYYFVLDQPATVTLSTCTSTCFDTVLYVRDVCTADTTQQVCNDDGPCAGCVSSTGSQSRASAPLAAGVHYLVVDTYPGTPCGAFTVTPQGVPP